MNSRVVVVLDTVDESQKSRADIVRRIAALCGNFDCAILTSAVIPCRQLFPDAEVQWVPHPDRPYGKMAFYLFGWLQIMIRRPRVVYLAEMSSSPCVALTWNKRVLCYGNTHPRQHSLLAKKKGAFLSHLSEKPYQFAMKRGLRKCSQVISISPGLTNAYRDFGVPEQNIVESGVGVPLDIFRPPRPRIRKPKDRWIVVHHGSVSNDRGLSVIVQGARLVAEKRKDFVIRLVGCGQKERNMVQQLSSREGVRDLVEALPKIPYDRIPQVLWSSDWGISLLEPTPYYRASPPLKVMEYLASGLPVIANRIQSHDLFLQDGVNSLLIDYDPMSFAHAMMNLMEDDDHRARLAAGALLTSSRFSDEPRINDLVGIVRTMLR